MPHGRRFHARCPHAPLPLRQQRRPDDSTVEVCMHTDRLAGDASHNHTVGVISSYEDVMVKRDDDRTDPWRPGREWTDIVARGQGINVNVLMPETLHAEIERFNERP